MEGKQLSSLPCDIVLHEDRRKEPLNYLSKLSFVLFSLFLLLSPILYLNKFCNLSVEA